MSAGPDVQAAEKAFANEASYSKLVSCRRGKACTLEFSWPAAQGSSTDLNFLGDDDTLGAGQVSVLRHCGRGSLLVTPQPVQTRLVWKELETLHEGIYEICYCAAIAESLNAATCSSGAEFSQYIGLLRMSAETDVLAFAESDLEDFFFPGLNLATSFDVKTEPSGSGSEASGVTAFCVVGEDRSVAAGCSFTAYHQSGASQTREFSVVPLSETASENASICVTGRRVTRKSVELSGRREVVLDAFSPLAAKNAICVDGQHAVGTLVVSGTTRNFSQLNPSGRRRPLRRAVFVFGVCL